MGLEFICHRYIVFIYFSFCSEELFVCSFLYVNQQFSMTSVLRVTVASMNLLGLYRDVERCRCRLDVYLTEACCPLWCAGWTRPTMVKEVQRPAAPGQATSWATPGETPSSSIAFHPAQNSVSPSFLHSNYHNIYSGTVCFFVHFARFFFEWYLCESVFDSHKKCEI